MDKYPTWQKIALALCSVLMAIVGWGVVHMFDWQADMEARMAMKVEKAYYDEHRAEIKEQLRDMQGQLHDLNKMMLTLVGQHRAGQGAMVLEREARVTGEHGK